MSNLRLKDVIGDYVESCKTIVKLQITISELRGQIDVLRGQIDVLQGEVYQLRSDVSYLKARTNSVCTYTSYGDDAYYISR